MRQKDIMHWPWKNDALHRLKASLAFNQLHQALLEHHSATLVLESWCRSHGISAHVSGVNCISSQAAILCFGADTEPSGITAQQIHGQTPPTLSDEEMALLSLLPGEKMGHRHVHLMFNGAIVSKADNWYVVSRLDPGMNDILLTTDTPFGKVVAPLSCHRMTVSSRRCFPATSPSENLGCQNLNAESKTNGVCKVENIETESPSDPQQDVISIPEVILEICATVCRGDDGRVLCYVRERYQGKLMDFSPSILPEAYRDS
ncbi:hypothetical protein NQ176_g2497 [Zarea fungicola]|uniref:Uncharacterized protein n=1 Tax=Zarea fungicola TaxID=93591 RepID=A0ACC1NP43_9HYPO|nr:hypothetical protein NQ176_g2497 [Lecanicillium fungicola]